MNTQKFYTYYSYEEWGRGYIGKRKCPLDKTPETDDYFGSFKDKTFKPTQKIILGVYSTDFDATSAEILLHEYFKVSANPHFANKAQQTSTSFSTCGVPAWNKGLSGLPPSWNKGIPHKESTKKKIGAKSKGRTHNAKTREKMAKSKLGSKNRSYKGETFTFKNTSDETIETNITILEMTQKYKELRYDGLRKIKAKERKSYKNWIVIW